jgi:uncharacterized membrane protein YoaK (UPF0700 family)
MPIAFIRGITAPERTDSGNRWLGCTLAFVAGATNVAGLLAVGRYTSHMSGLVSSIADNAIHWTHRACPVSWVSCGVLHAGFSDIGDPSQLETSAWRE